METPVLRSAQLGAPRARHTALALAAIMLVTLGACTRAALVRRADARRLGSELEVQFTRVVEATNRAVLADTDEDSVAAAREAAAAAAQVARKRTELQDVLTSLGDAAGLAQLREFEARFAALETLDAEVLSLAVENTNLKAQRLSFGAAREAAGAFRAAVEAAAAASPNAARARAVAAQATIAVLDIQVLQAPHIAEPADPPMRELETRMAASAGEAGARLDELRPLAGRSASRHVDAAAAALREFLAVNTEIVALSRRNTNVRSLALALGQRRRLTAACEDRLRGLQDVLARHEETGTR